MSDFGTELTRWMEERGVGVRELHRRSGYSAGYISQLRQRRRVPSPEAARDFDDALGADGALAACLPNAREMNRDRGASNAAGGALEVMAWITGTNTSDDAIDEIARAAAYLAEAHTRMAARAVLSEVLGVHQAVRALLRGGRQRLRQTRELLRTEAALLAHASLLLGDVGQHQEAREYGNAALLCAQEVEADEGIAWSVMAKTARWQDRFAEAAGLARRGFEVSGQLPVQAELAYREANAVALFGDAPRARRALQRAERAAENLDDDASSVWSFPRARQAVFALSVCVHTGDADAALDVARAADAWWNDGGAQVTATWAQVRAGAALAYLLKDSLDGAASQLAPVLGLAPELRIQTVTGWMEEVSAALADPRFSGSALGAGLRQQVREFCSSAV
ncbi:MAG TPA: helix-turn-helix domain-containing protein [Trebonia sp.]|jgi:transcriptional regulator with XRE-family HTH domain